MEKEKLVSLFNFVYLSIIDNPDYNLFMLKQKNVHFKVDCYLSGYEKRTLVSKVNGKLRRNKTIEKINLAKNELIRTGRKITQHNVALASGLAWSIVKRNYKRCLEDINEIVTQVNTNVDSVISNGIIPHPTNDSSKFQED